MIGILPKQDSKFIRNFSLASKNGKISFVRKQKTYFIKTYGCQANEADSGKIGSFELILTFVSENMSLVNILQPQVNIQTRFGIVLG